VRPSLGATAIKSFRKVVNVWAFYIGFALIIPFALGIAQLWRKSITLLTAGVLTGLGFLLVSFPWPSYVAPMAGFFMICSMLGLERLRTVTWPNKMFGRFLSRALPTVIGVGLLPPIANAIIGWPEVGHNMTDRSCCTTSVSGPRARVQSLLEKSAGRHLVIVRYDDKYPAFVEWVWNSANIDSSKVVWAHDLGATKNQQIIGYFPDRRVWTITAGDPPQLEEYRTGRRSD
jgi:hypothetical protein